MTINQLRSKLSILRKPIENRIENLEDGKGWEYFDDCLICKAMQKADEQGRNLSQKELSDAFRRANERQKQKAKIGLS